MEAADRYWQEKLRAPGQNAFVLLHEGLLRLLGQAEDALLTEDFLLSNDILQRAQLVVFYIQQKLPEPEHQAYYMRLHELLVEANMSSSVEAVTEIREGLLDAMTAWENAG